MAVDLTQGKVWWQLCRMAGPMMIGIFAIMSMYFADSYFISKLGVRPLAAMGFVLPMISVLSALGFGFGSAASSFVSRAFGQQDEHSVGLYASQGLAVAFVHAIAFSLFGRLFAPDIFRMMGASEQLLDMILAYANIWFNGCFLVIVPMVANSIIRGTGNTRLPSVLMLIIAGVNILLDPLFIFGWKFIPAMGIQGAALASLTAYSVAFVVALYVLARRLGYLQLKYLKLWSWPVWRSLLHIAYPSILTNLVVPVSIGITTAMVAKYGEVAVAGLSVALRIESFALVPIFGLASVMAPFVGQNMGAGRVERMSESLTWSTKAMMLYGAFVYIVIMLAGQQLVSIFHIPAAVELEAIRFLELVGWCYGLLGLAVITNSCANALAMPMIALTVNLGRLFVVYLPLIYLFQYLWGIEGVYLAIGAATLIMAAVSVYLRRFFLPGDRSV